MTREKDVDRRLHQFEIGSIFKKFDQLVRYKGTHLMAKEIDLLRKYAYEAVAKSNTDTGLADTQENFQTKLEELRWVNGYNDVTDDEFFEIYGEWVNIVLEMIDEWFELGVFDYDRDRERIEINVGQVTAAFVTVEVSYYPRDAGG